MSITRGKTIQLRNHAVFGSGGKQIILFFPSTTLYLLYASVERIFSQVKLICDAIGVSGLKETIVACMYERCNDYSILSQS